MARHPHPHRRQYNASTATLPPYESNTQRRHIQDGFRTPTIEDAHHPANLQFSHWAAQFAAAAAAPRLLPARPNSSQSNHSGSHLLQNPHDEKVQLNIHHAEATGSEPVGLQPSSRARHHEEVPIDTRPLKLSWRRRMKHVTWAYFTLSMATGGIANVLSAVPFRFRGLYTIGLLFFILNVVLYICIWGMILARFYFYPATFRASFRHPTESLFIPAFAIAFSTILINIVEYGFGTGPPNSTLLRAVLVLFWIDAALAVIMSLAVYLILWSTQTFTIAQMTPIWIFPAYPLLIIGPYAGNLAERLLAHSPPRFNSLESVVVGGFTIQGIGFLVSLTIYAAFVYRLMTQKLPSEPIRPGMFVSVGPSAFTVTGTIVMAKYLALAIGERVSVSEVLGIQYMGMDAVLAGNILRLIANWMSLWLWGLGFWFFFVSVLSHWKCLKTNHHMPFGMTWFSFIFPQTALTTATFAIGDAFDSYALKVIGCVMTCLLIPAWFGVVTMMMRAVALKHIMWPEVGEDKEEGGFRPMPKVKKLPSRVNIEKKKKARSTEVRYVGQIV